jgi:single-strand DNA-binding protein
LNTNIDLHRIILWRGLAGFTEKYVHKGSVLFVEGKIKTRSYDEKDGVKIM